ncbi:MAG: heavy-metal-associated domain-containing protein [Clostridia bacterium]|nr:heavy-metal-associated domain-containing protein [Clostridia bacterium]
MELKIENMSCMHCVKRVENALKEIKAKNIKVEIGKATFDGTDENLAISAIEDLGFNCKLLK